MPAGSFFFIVALNAVKSLTTRLKSRLPLQSLPPQAECMSSHHARAPAQGNRRAAYPPFVLLPRLSDYVILYRIDW